jgi:hypothetical protein
MILESIVFGSLIFLFLLLIADGIRMRSSRRELRTRFLQSEVDKALLSERLLQLMAEKDSKGIESSDGFLKFISESRDWAFTYIEDVQKALEEFDSKITPILDYYSTYGSSVEGLHTGLTEDIKAAYVDLKSMLPSK